MNKNIKNIKNIKNNKPAYDAVIKAVQNNDVNALRQALDAGANLHIRRGSALCIAAANGNLDIVVFLVQRGAKINIKKCYLIRIAIDNRHFDVIDFLIDAGAYVSDWNLSDLSKMVSSDPTLQSICL